MKRNRGVSPVEWMIVTAAREIRDAEVLMVGTQWPIPVALLAKKLHAPCCVLCFEGGLVLEDLPERTPLLTADAGLASAASSMGDCLTALGAILHGGRADRALLTAAHVDRYGNLNTTCVGSYQAPRMRFGGSGGACDFGSLAGNTLIVVEQSRLRFPEKVDFITTPGPSRGPVRKGKKKNTPSSKLRRSTIVTTMGRFSCTEGGEMLLTGYRSDLKPNDIREQVQWNLRLSSDCTALVDPTRVELRILRNEVDPLGLYIHNRKQSPLSFSE